MSTNSLEKISSFSFPSNHLINFQLMRDLEKVQTAKPEYFFFVSFVPGAQGGEGGNRTYDFNSSVSLKFAVYEFAGLAWALKQYAQGNGKHINYVKFTKSGTGAKTLVLEEASKASTGKNNEQYMQRQVLLKVASGGNTKAVSMTLDQAYAVGEMLDLLFKKAAELEFNRSMNTTSFTRNQPENKGFVQNPPISNNNNNVSKPENNAPHFTVDDDDNSNFLGGGFSGFNNSNPFM